MALTWAACICQTGSSGVASMSALGLVMMLMVAEILSCLDAAHFTGDGTSKFKFLSRAGEAEEAVAVAGAEAGAGTVAVALEAAVATTAAVAEAEAVAGRLPSNSLPPPRSTRTRPVLVTVTPPTPPASLSVDMAVAQLPGTSCGITMLGRRTTSVTGETVGDCTGVCGSLTGDSTRLMGRERFLPIEHCCSCCVKVRHSLSLLLVCWGCCCSCWPLCVLWLVEVVMLLEDLDELLDWYDFRRSNVDSGESDGELCWAAPAAAAAVAADPTCDPAP